MNELHPTDWAALRTNGGTSGIVVHELLRELESGDFRSLDELREQVCHQLSAESASYPAVIRLVALARASDSPARQAELLAIVASVEVARTLDPSGTEGLPEEVLERYRVATREAGSLASELIGRVSPGGPESYRLLTTLAALHGHPNVAAHLLLSTDSDHLSCPECGEYIRFRTSPENG